jgi:hypothetical protein
MPQQERNKKDTNREKSQKWQTSKFNCKRLKISVLNLYLAIDTYRCLHGFTSRYTSQPLRSEPQHAYYLLFRF